METVNLIYHFTVLAMAVLIFFMKFTAPGAFLELIIKAAGKFVPLFVIGYSMVQIFKYYGIL